MELTYSDLAKDQLKLLSIYLLEQFGLSVSDKRMRELDDHIFLLRTFQDISPVYMQYKGFTVKKLAHKYSHVFYTIHNNAVYIVSITDTRMSQTNVRLLIKDELNKLKQGTN